MSDRLFAVYLGGRAPKCHTELHDVVFVAGDSIEATYEQLMDQWFGTVEDLHVDSWIELKVVDGHKITLTKRAANGGKCLYFVNLGAYADGVFGELHDNCFLVAGSKAEAKSRAKMMLSKSLPGHIHTDDLHDVDDCIALEHIGPYHIDLEITDGAMEMRPVNGYHIIPETIIQDYLARKNPPV